MNAYWNGSSWTSYAPGYGSMFTTDGGTGDFTLYSTGNAASAGLARTLSPVLAVTAAGTVSATRFVGDGSGLTGVVASTGDRIVSGTTSMIAFTSTGLISITQAGTNTGYFHPSLGLVTVGVSSTGGISGTTGYFSGNVGIGTTAPVDNAGYGGLTLNGSTGGILSFSAGGTEYGRVNGNATGMDIQAINGVPLYLQTNNAQSIVFQPNKVTAMTILSGGNVGIGTTAPQYTLDVNGWAQAQGLQVSNTTQYQSINFFQTGVLKFQIVNDNNWVTSIGNADTRDLRFAISSTEVMRLVSNSGPRLGVGTPWPTTTLDVSGTSSATNFKTAGTLQLGSYSSQPVACAAGYKGMVAMSNTLNDLCLCNGTSWVRAGSGGTACAW